MGLGAVLKSDQYLRMYVSKSIGVGAIDNLELFEQVFDPYYILEVPEKIFTHNIVMVCRQKMLVVGV